MPADPRPGPVGPDQGVLGQLLGLPPVAGEQVAEAAQPTVLGGEELAELQIGPGHLTLHGLRPLPQRATWGKGCAPGYIRSSSSRFMRWNSSSVTTPRSRRSARRSRSSRGVGGRVGVAGRAGGVGVRSAAAGWGWVVA
jgi:hypothetical protein